MKVTVIGKNINVTPALKEMVEKKISKLDRYFSPDVEARATLTVQRNNQIFEVTIPFNGVILRCEESSEDMYKSIDLVEAKLERQIRKQRTKLQRRSNDSLRFANFEPLTVDENEEKEYDSPFQLWPAIQFAGLIVIIKFLSIVGKSLEHIIPPEVSNYQPTSGILRVFRQFSTPWQDVVFEPAPRPSHQRVTQAVSPLIVVKFLGVILENALYLIVEFPKSYATLQRRPCLLPQPQRVEIYRRTGSHHPSHRTTKIRLLSAK